MTERHFLVATETKYRADIDGLRAVAVAAVVIYHFGAYWLPGGFTGVDVFFVISGFLITTIMRREISTGDFSLIAFYRRRIRRIVPALVFMLTCLLTAGWFFLMPAEYALLARSAKYAALGWSNLFFLRNTDYFDVLAEAQPLLHTWSLGVEEQFYLVWPLALVLAARFGVPQRKLLILLLLSTLASFLYANVLILIEPKSAFYLPHARFWELSVGALVAFAPNIKSEKLSQIASSLGLCLVLGSFSLLEAGNPFPGLNAMWSVLGAALLVWPKESNIAAQILSRKPLVGLGLISYSLYLWHWPIAVYFRYFTLGREPKFIESVLLITLSTILALLSYYLIERPFRSKGLPGATFAAVGAGILVLTSIVITRGDGFPDRLPDQVVRLASGVNDFSKNTARCRHDDQSKLPEFEGCILGDTAQIPDVALWGDSHGMEISDALGDLLQRSERSLQILAYSGCPPIAGYVAERSKGCAAFTVAAENQIISESQIKTVVLASRFELHIKDFGASNFEKDFEKTVRNLVNAGKKVIIVRSTPTFAVSVPLAAGRLQLVGIRRVPTISIEQYLDRTKVSREMVDRLGKRFPTIVVIDPLSTLCNFGECPLVQDGQSMLFDDNHLSMAGARRVAESIYDQL